MNEHVEQVLRDELKKWGDNVKSRLVLIGMQDIIKKHGEIVHDVITKEYGKNWFDNKNTEVFLWYADIACEIIAQANRDMAEYVENLEFLCK